MLCRLPECVLARVCELARSRALLRRVGRRYRLHVDRWLLPSASVPLQLTVSLDPRLGGRSAWKDLLSRIRPPLAQQDLLSRSFWQHRSLRLVSPALVPVLLTDPRPARLAAWPTLINCLRASVEVGVARHIASVQIEFAAPYVDRLCLESLRPFGVLTVTDEEVRSLFSQTSLRSFSLRAAACDRTATFAPGSFSALCPLVDRLSFGLARCAALSRLELVDITPAVYGTKRSQGGHRLREILPMATHLLCETPLSSLRLEGVSASLVESFLFWEAVAGLQRPIGADLVDAAIFSRADCCFQ